MLKEIEDAEFFQSSLDYGIAVPDGSYRLIRAKSGDRVKRLVYDGRTDFSDVGDHASPSKAQLKAFVTMWQRVEKALAEAKPATMADETDGPNLTYPER